jgi:hypothetical protein
VKYHLKFRNFKRATITATEQLFDSHPWWGDDEEKQAKFETWLKDVSAAYGVPVPQLRVDPGMTLLGMLGGYDPEHGAIYLCRYSVTTLFHEYRHHLQMCGLGDSGAEDDALGWACSLFYRVRPRAFRKAVRAGRIVGVEAADLLRSIPTVDDFLTEVLGTPGTGAAEAS